MPAETKAGSDTEVWAKVSLPSSEGLRGELPVVVPSGDVIQKGDARASSFPVRFPVDARTGQRLPIQAELRLSAGDFLIAAPGQRIEVEIPPDSDSRTVIFMLEANPQGKKSGRSRIVIDLIYEAKIIAQISVSTVLVEQVTAAVPSWTLAAAVYAAPPTGAVSPSTGEIAPGSAAASEVALRDVPSAQPSVSDSPVAPAQLSDERERRERREQREQQDRGAFGAAVPLADDVAGDDVLPTYEEKAKKSEAADNYVPQPATTPQYSGSATRSPMGEPQGMPSGSQAAFEAMPRRAPRRASNTPLRLASVFAGLGLVFVVVLAITRQAAIPLNVNGSATTTLATQFALLITETPLHVSTVVATVLSTASCGDDHCSAGETSDTCPKDCAVSNPFITETPTSQPTATSSEASDGFTATPQIPAITHSPTELPNSGGGPGDIEVAPMVDCSGVPGSDLVRLLIRNGFAAVLLDEGVTTQDEARQFSESKVVAWGVCKRDSLTLNLELVQTPNVRGINNPESITLQTQPDMLAQRDSHAARVVAAVTEYAAGSSDYTALAQTFEDLAAAATSADERAALRTLQSNSSYLANHPDVLTQVALTQASR